MMGGQKKSHIKWFIKDEAPIDDGLDIASCLRNLSDYMRIICEQSMGHSDGSGLGRYGAMCAVEIYKLLIDRGGLLHSCFGGMYLPPIMQPHSLSPWPPTCREFKSRIKSLGGAAKFTLTPKDGSPPAFQEFGTCAGEVSFSVGPLPGVLFRNQCELSFIDFCDLDGDWITIGAWLQQLIITGKTITERSPRKYSIQDCLTCLRHRKGAHADTDIVKKNASGATPSTRPFGHYLSQLI